MLEQPANYARQTSETCHNQNVIEDLDLKRELMANLRKDFIVAICWVWKDDNDPVASLAVCMGVNHVKFKYVSLACTCCIFIDDVQILAEKASCKVSAKLDAATKVLQHLIILA